MWYTLLHWSLSNEKICIKFHLDNNLVCKSLRGHLEQWDRYVWQKTQYGKRKHTRVILLWYRLKLHVCMMENKYEGISNQIALKLKGIFAFSSGLFPPSLLSLRAFFRNMWAKNLKGKLCFYILQEFATLGMSKTNRAKRWIISRRTLTFSWQERKTCWSLLAYIMDWRFAAK